MHSSVIMKLSMNFTSCVLNCFFRSMSCEATNLVFYVQSTSTGISGRGERERSTIYRRAVMQTNTGEWLGRRVLKTEALWENFWNEI